MPSARLGLPHAPANLELTICGVDLAVRGPDFVVAMLSTMLAGVPRATGVISTQLTINVEASSGTWEIIGALGSRMVLSAHCELPRVAGAVISMMLQDVAAHSSMTTARATVVEKNGRGLAIVGDDWESGLTLATHLHARGWRYVSGDHALVDSDSFRAFRFEKSLYVTASAAAAFPLSYRRAVEGSPWYVASNEIAFYAVDPTVVEKNPWSDGAVLQAFLLVDGETDDRPSLASVNSAELGNRAIGLKVDRATVDVCKMTLGPIIESCDLAERWFDAIPGRLGQQ